MRIGLRLYLLLVYFSTNCIVQEEVKLDGKVGLDGVCAVACAVEWRFNASALLP